MAKWDSGADETFQKIKADTNSSDQRMADLKTQIEAWAEHTADGVTDFPFPAGLYRNGRVQVWTKGGWITKLEWGED